MKKAIYVLMAFSVLMMASCVQPGEKAAGNYSGNYTSVSNTQPGMANVTKASDNSVNIVMDCPNLAISSTANGVTVAADGDNVTFSYSNSSTTAGDVLSISGTLSGNTLSLSWSVSLGGSFSVSGTFSGNK